MALIRLLLGKCHRSEDTSEFSFSCGVSLWQQQALHLRKKRKKNAKVRNDHGLVADGAIDGIKTHE